MEKGRGRSHVEEVGGGVEKIGRRRGGKVFIKPENKASARVLPA